MKKSDNTSVNKSSHLLKSFTIGVLAISLILGSCGLSRAVKGGAIGAASGGAIGGLIGHKAGNTAVGVLVGAAVGGTAGALIGRHMDKQAEKLQKDLEGATVQRVGEGILITFDKGMQFDVNKYAVPTSGTANLNELAAVLKEYEDTDILIEGHTDNSGDHAYNQTLSENRAQSVKKYLINNGIAANRISSLGYGEDQPLQDNETEQGRAANRRVEVAIYANKKMQKMAEKGEL
jgi:outer membrane protein OmpA-like peptidoglycan-associated protein